MMSCNGGCCGDRDKPKPRKKQSGATTNSGTGSSNGNMAVTTSIDDEAVQFDKP